MERANAWGDRFGGGIKNEMEEADRIVDGLRSYPYAQILAKIDLVARSSWNHWECRAAVAKHPDLPSRKERWLIHRLALDRSVGVRRSTAKRTDLLPYQRCLLEWEGKCHPALRWILEEGYWLYGAYGPPSNDPATGLYKFIATGENAQSTWAWLLSEMSDPRLRSFLVSEWDDVFMELSRSVQTRLSRDSSPLVRAEFLTGFVDREDAVWPKARRYRISLDGFAAVIGSTFRERLPDIEGFRDGKDPPEQEDIRRFALETGWSGTLGELIKLVTTGSLTGSRPKLRS